MGAVVFGVLYVLVAIPYLLPARRVTIEPSERLTSDVAYNYPRFDEYVTSGREAEEFGAFRAHLHVGEVAPDTALIRLDDDSEVRLSQLWATQPVVMEFGSFT